MQPPFIVLVPWVGALVLEAWLLFAVFRRGIHRELPVFTSMVLIYTILDAVVFVAALARFHTYSMYTLREISSAVLRTWLMIEMSRHIFTNLRWTRRVLLAILLLSAALLIGIGFPIFLREHLEGIANAYLAMGVWFRTVYFAQVGVICVMLLLYFNSTESSFTREIGIAIGLATASGTELVTLTLRGRPDMGSNYMYISLNYIGMITATSIWLMFMHTTAKEAKPIPASEEPKLERAASQAAK